MSMVTGLMPVVGIPLPLLSYGGTAMLSIMISFGLLLNADIFLKNFGERKECNNFFSWLEKKNISPIEACISFARYSTADKIIVGFANSTELELFSDIFERVKEFSPPRFCDDEEILNPMNWKD